MGEPSQNPADAERDGVVPALAALSISLRVDPELTVPSEEGLWVLSRPKPETMDLAPGCGLGDPDGVYGRDIICVVEYGEVLLMDPTGERILRAYPLPGLPPYHPEMTEAGLIVEGWGGERLVDPTTLEL